MLPTLQDCQSYADQGYTLIPVYRRLVYDDLSPVGAFERLAEESHGFLFESVVGGESLARYSMAGVAPSAQLIGRAGQVDLCLPDGSRRRLAGGTIAALRAYLADLRSPDVPGLPRFSGGLVGYFAYDFAREVESLPNCPEDPLDLPDVHLMRFDTLMVFDHSFNHLLLITHLAVAAGEDVASAYAEAEACLKTLEHRLRWPSAPRLVELTGSAEPNFSCHTSRQEFEDGVERIKEYIRAGDIFQAVPSQRLSMPLTVSPLQVYRSVRSLNPSPYMFIVRLGEASLVGASPEILVSVEQGRVAVRPIAGTIHRGDSPEEDERLAAELLADPKERAEHVMLIDLGRNDVGRVCKPGSVRLDEQMTIERYSHVQHIVSHVSGELRTDCDALDALAAVHPAGTVSGAPKIRAMEIIDELEPVKRGPYAGAVGYLDFRGNLDTCIALRTAILAGGQAHVQAGAGVVADSVPAKEWQETMNKAQAMLRAIARAADF
ncbi:MAG: anthranilate synthase component I [Planctomycetota bacterium]|nr:MAG: anthranilate synthase component I [Planctomycetota bacterium]